MDGIDGMDDNEWDLGISGRGRRGCEGKHFLIGNQNLVAGPSIAESGD
jgi:hypothetical protein